MNTSVAACLEQGATCTVLNITGGSNTVAIPASIATLSFLTVLDM